MHATDPPCSAHTTSRTAMETGGSTTSVRVCDRPPRCAPSTPRPLHPTPPFSPRPWVSSVYIERLPAPELSLFGGVSLKPPSGKAPGACHDHVPPSLRTFLCIARLLRVFSPPSVAFALLAGPLSFVTSALLFLAAGPLYSLLCLLPNNHFPRILCSPQEQHLISRDARGVKALAPDVELCRARTRLVARGGVYIHRAASIAWISPFPLPPCG